MAKYNKYGERNLRPNISLTDYEVEVMFRYIEEKGITFNIFAESLIRRRLINIAEYQKEQDAKKINETK